jgi:DNA topoisomerase VI subunit B
VLDYCSEKSLTLEIGHGRDEWPLVALKELLDNALDACEDVGVAPEITVSVNAGGITVTDNGPGIPPETVAAVLNFSQRVSSREHYVSPTRGAQGNALKSLVMMPFVLDGRSGCVEIVAKGIHHRIQVMGDRIRQEPVFDHQQQPVGADVPGSKITVHWPDSAIAQSCATISYVFYKSPSRMGC